MSKSSVEFKEIGTIFRVITGLSGKTKDDFIDGNAKYITYSNIYNNPSINLDVVDYVKVSDNENQNHIKYKDVLITGSSENLEDSGMFSVVCSEPTEKIYLNSFCFCLRLNDEYYEKFDANYLKYYFRSPSFRSKIIKCSSGVTRYNLSKEKLFKVKIPIPSINEQKEIAKQLDEYYLTYNSFILKLSEEIEQRKNQYNYLLNNILIDSNWKVYKLSDVVDIFLGLTHTPNYVEDGVKFISSLNISKDYLDLENVKYISKEEYDSITENAKPKKGDILYVRVGSNLGHPVIFDSDEKVCIFVSVGFLRVKINNVLPEYVRYWMSSNLFNKQVLAKTKNIPKANLNSTWMKEFKISIPDISTQKSIVELLDKYNDLYINLSKTIDEEIEQRKNQYNYWLDKLTDFKEG